MNEALLLVLVTLAQSRGDGFRNPEPGALGKWDEDLDDSQWKGQTNAAFSLEPSKSYLTKFQPYPKRSTNDALTRRSALDKNFMRFGRKSSESEPQFFRFDLGGNPEEMVRFGRSGKSSFIRFGRSEPEDFLRFGKSLRENFIRFGKGDKNFMRFGRTETGQSKISDKSGNLLLSGNNGEKIRERENFDWVGKSPGTNFLRFGKSGNQKEGKNGTNFVRFGKKDPTLKTENPECVASEIGEEDVAEDDSSTAMVKRGKRTIREANDDFLRGKKFTEFLFSSKPEKNRKNNENPKAGREKSPIFFEKTLKDVSEFPPAFVADFRDNSNQLKNSESFPHFPPATAELPTSPLNFYSTDSDSD